MVIGGRGLSQIRKGSEGGRLISNKGSTRIYSISRWEMVRRQREDETLTEHF